MIVYICTVIVYICILYICTAIWYIFTAIAIISYYTKESKYYIHNCTYFKLSRQNVVKTFYCVMLLKLIGDGLTDHGLADIATYRPAMRARKLIKM